MAAKSERGDLLCCCKVEADFNWLGQRPLGRCCSLFPVHSQPADRRRLKTERSKLSQRSQTCRHLAEAPRPAACTAEEQLGFVMARICYGPDLLWPGRRSSAFLAALDRPEEPPLRCLPASSALLANRRYMSGLAVPCYSSSGLPSQRLWEGFLISLGFLDGAPDLEGCPRLPGCACELTEGK